jgi:ABC-type multidrug transport system fused ATPase/permease subunit
MTLLSTDVERLWQATLYMNWLWVAPVLFVIAMILLYFRIGISAVAAIGALFLINYVQTMSGNMTGVCRERMVKYTDSRVKVTNEILQGIRVIKYYAWELPMKEKVTEIRNKEVKHLIQYQGYLLLNNILAFIGPSLVSFAMFLCYVMLGNTLTIPTVYSALAFLNIIRMPLSMLPKAYSCAVEALQSFKRLTRFMLLEEVQGLNAIELDPEPEANMVPASDASELQRSLDERKIVAEIRNANFIWDSMEAAVSEPGAAASKSDAVIGLDEAEQDAIESKSTSTALSSPSHDPLLKNINLTILEGEFIAVVGTVGSGKSSLIAALLGQMYRTQGEQFLRRSGSNDNVALVTQEHWIQNMSLMENVLFGNPMDEERYANVLDASQLSKDLLHLAHGDYTSIGERGINLSGGQKARVSIARALYQPNIDLYIFDDPLAAVDVHVGKAIFHQAFLQYLGSNQLKKKTRIVVMSSNYHFLPFFDRVVVMKKGRIAAAGTYDDVAAKCPEYSATASHEVTVSTPVGQMRSDDDQEQSDQANREILEDEGTQADDVQLVDRTDDSGSSEDTSRNAEIGVASQYREHLEVIRHKRTFAKEIMTQEERERGAVTLSTFSGYFDAALRVDFSSPSASPASRSRWLTPGMGLFLAIIVLFILGQTGRTIGDMWVGQWAMHGNQGNHHIDRLYFDW